MGARRMIVAVIAAAAFASCGGDDPAPRTPHDLESSPFVVQAGGAYVPLAPAETDGGDATRTHTETDATNKTSAHAETNATNKASAHAETNATNKASAHAETDATNQTSTHTETDATNQTSTQTETDATNQTSTHTETDATDQTSARPPPAVPAERFETALVVRRTTLRGAPGGRVVARVGTRTEFGSPRVLAVTGRRAGWLRVIASERANDRHGWIRSSAARLGATDVSLRVDRSRRRLTLRHGSRVLRRLPVAVGRPDTPTPLGRFAVTDLLRARRADSPYGCCALALSGHQTKLLPGWPGGDRLAIHGTPNPETVGTPASLGCMRAHTDDIKALMRLVPLGAPVFVVA